MPDDLHDAAALRLRRISQRYTGGRRALVGVLAGSGRPLSIPEVLERDPSLAESSVYRNLAVLEQAGVVARIVTNHDHNRYELSERFGEHHHHLVCTNCGEISDFTLPAAVEQALDTALERVARRAGYRPDTHRLDVVGTCATCQHE